MSYEVRDKSGLKRKYPKGVNYKLLDELLLKEMYGGGAGREGNKYETLESEHFPSVSSLNEVAEKAVIEEEGRLSCV